MESLGDKMLLQKFAAQLVCLLARSYFFNVRWTYATLTLLYPLRYFGSGALPSRLIRVTPDFGTVHIWYWEFMTWIFGAKRVSQKKFRAWFLKQGSKFKETTKTSSLTKYFHISHFTFELSKSLLWWLFFNFMENLPTVLWMLKEHTELSRTPHDSEQASLLVQSGPNEIMHNILLSTHLPFTNKLWFDMVWFRSNFTLDEACKV